jgi:hypothetical protein
MDIYLKVLFKLSRFRVTGTGFKPNAMDHYPFTKHLLTILGDLHGPTKTRVSAEFETKVAKMRTLKVGLIIQPPQRKKTLPTFFSNGSTAPWGPRSPQFSRLHYHTLFRHTTIGRTPLDEGPARRRDLYLTTHNTHKRQTSMP